MRRIVCLAILGALGAFAQALPVAAASDTLVSVGSPTTPFPQSWQNTPAVAVDPAHPSVLAATAIDTLDAAACSAWDDPAFCPFGRVGLDGVYFSFDGGSSWTQPTYTGLTRRHCLGPAECQLTLDDLSGGLEIGPIGTVPNHYQAGLFSTSDPVVAFGPAPGPDGAFSWDNGSRLYHTHRVQEFDPDSPWFKPAVNGGTAVGLSRIDGAPALTPQIVADQANWMPPVVVREKRSENDWLVAGEFGTSVWADNAESSPNFGHVYFCGASSREDLDGGIVSTQIVLDVSADGGTTWDGRNVSRASSRRGGRAGCLVRTDSEGTVYLFWNEGFLDDREVVTMTRSFDGGRSFEKPRAILDAVHCGTLQELQIDGVMGAGGSPLASVDIVDGAQAGDRPNLPTIAISPDGEDVYLVYLGFLDPWRESLSGSRRVQAVVLHADASNLSTWAALHRGVIADARAATAMSGGGRQFGYLGATSAAAAARDGAILLWTDIRNAERCPAIEAYRQSIVDDEESPLPPPAVNSDCPPRFGNSDIYGTSVADPTPSATR